MVVWVAREKSSDDGRTIYVTATKKELMECLQGTDIADWNIGKERYYAGTIG